MAPPPLRLAIIGLGPRGLSALERLVHHAHSMSAELIVDAYEAHPVPGPGPVYDPAQPPYLRMNLAADRLDLWSGENAAVPRAERLSFPQWSTRYGAGAPEGADPRYPPRGVIGEYLADGLQRVLRRLPDGLRFSLVPREARTIHPDADRWVVTAADGERRVYEEVLIATGHGRWGSPGPSRPWAHAAPLVPAVFPVTRWLTTERVRPGATVAVRGFALTFLDAALALTEGRGGTFEADAHPNRLRYESSADDAGVLLPFSRTGRPMLPKPEPELARSVPRLEDIVGLAVTRVTGLRPGFALRDALLPIVADCAAASLLAARGRPDGAETRVRLARAFWSWLDRACEGRLAPSSSPPSAEVARSLDVGAGLRPPGPSWALAQTWQGLYPSLVHRLEGPGLGQDEWPPFLRLATEMERIAFGPPPANAAKLLALVAARKVDVSFVRGSHLTTAGRVTSLGREGTRTPVDVVVDAVLAPPGAHGARSVLIEGLVAGGSARVAPRRRGLEVTADANCVGRDGARTPGLSAIGRMTEDWVIGNDTLNRRLHAHADGWARRVAHAAADSAPTRLAGHREHAA